MSGTVKADPRAALFITFVLTFTVISPPNLIQIIIILLIFISAILHGMTSKAIKYILFYAIMFSASYSINQYDIQKVKGFQFLLHIIVKIFPVLFTASLLSEYSPGEIAAGLTKMKMGRIILLPFIVALRFIPTLRVEMKQILDAMHLRNLSFRSGYGFIHPLKTIRNIFVPLMFRCLQISDELGASATTRGIDAPVKRTCAQQISFKPFDYIICVIFAVLTVVYLFVPCPILVIQT